MSKEIHIGCGGTIENRTCSKCGKQWGKMQWVFTKDILIVDNRGFDKAEYKRRIREGRDIHK